MLADPSSRTHEVLLVTISGREWLADVGFGGPGLREPIPLVEDQVFEQGGAFYRLKRNARYGWMLQKKSEDGFFDIYVFDENEVTLDNDIEMANHYTATWPQSIFRLQRMAALPTPQGRITLADMELTIYRNGETSSQALPPGSQYIEAIRKHFGIDLDVRYEDLATLGRARSTNE
jgi:N-hydroxyarylamine O-acetyltransferase